MAEYEEQKKAKLAFEDAIMICTNEKRKQAALDFVRFMSENRMKPQWGAKNSYNFSYKGKRVCIVKVHEDGFEIRANTQYNEDFNKTFVNESERIKAMLIDTVVYCFGCGTCKPGIQMTLLGRPIKAACYNPVIRLENPDFERIELAKKLVLLRRQMIAEGKVPKVTYIAKSKR